MSCMFFYMPNEIPRYRNAYINAAAHLAGVSSKAILVQITTDCCHLIFHLNHFYRNSLQWNNWSPTAPDVDTLTRANTLSESFSTGSISAWCAWCTESHDEVLSSSLSPVLFFRCLSFSARCTAKRLDGGTNSYSHEACFPCSGKKLPRGSALMHCRFGFYWRSCQRCYRSSTGCACKHRQRRSEMTVLNCNWSSHLSKTLCACAATAKQWL